MNRNFTDRFAPVGIALLIAAFIVYIISSHQEPTSEKITVISTTAVGGTQDHTVGTTETTAVEISSAPASSPQTQVLLCSELNMASAADLMRVDGIGEVLAERIVAYRSANGGFTDRSQLLNIEGVGDALMKRIMAEFSIAGETMHDETTAVTTDITKPAETTGTTIVTAGRYNLNEVTREELLLIPDMTEELADDILALRELIQYYTHLYEVLYVDGIDGAYVEYVLAKHLYVELPEVTLIHP